MLQKISRLKIYGKRLKNLIEIPGGETKDKSEK